MSPNYRHLKLMSPNLRHLKLMSPNFQTFKANVFKLLDILKLMSSNFKTFIVNVFKLQTFKVDVKLFFSGLTRYFGGFQFGHHFYDFVLGQEMLVDVGGVLLYLQQHLKSHQLQFGTQLIRWNWPFSRQFPFLVLLCLLQLRRHQHKRRKGGSLAASLRGRTITPAVQMSADIDYCLFL